VWRGGDGVVLLQNVDSRRSAVMMDTIHCRLLIAVGASGVRRVLCERDRGKARMSLSERALSVRYSWHRADPVAG